MTASRRDEKFGIVLGRIGSQDLLAKVLMTLGVICNSGKVLGCSYVSTLGPFAYFKIND